MTVLAEADEQVLDGLVQMKVVWSTRLFPRLFDVYRQRVEQTGVEPSTWQEAARVLETAPTYTLFATLERELQREKYAVLLPAFEAKQDVLAAELASAETGPSRLELDPLLPLPRYYTAVDFHQHPGGVWSDDIDGFVYEYAARSTNPTFNNNQEIFRLLASALPAEGYQRILDMGCGFGKSTLPLAEQFPAAQVTGIDLAAPCLKVAHLRASERGLALSYSQQNAEHTRFADRSFDLITAQQLLHEVPRAALRNILAEAFRLLRPGGRFTALDFHSPGGPFATFIHYGHARRNQEVFMRLFAETDLAAEFERAGFGDYVMLPFGEQLGRGPGRDGARPHEWRFPWKLITAVRPRTA